MNDETIKQNAAYKAVENELKPHHKYIGIGTGTTIKYILEKIVASYDYNNMFFVPTSLDTLDQLIRLNLNIGHISNCHLIEVAFDGADEADCDLNLIKGGGGALYKEKVIAYYAKKFVVVGGKNKLSTYLGEKYKEGIPVEVDVDTLYLVRSKLQNMGYKANIRLCNKGKIGPIITDSGNCIIDVIVIDNRSYTPAKVENDIKNIAGVVEVGLFCNMAHCGYFGKPDGSVHVMVNKRN